MDNVSFHIGEDSSDDSMQESDTEGYDSVLEINKAALERTRQMSIPINTPRCVTRQNEKVDDQSCVTRLSEKVDFQQGITRQSRKVDVQPSDKVDIHPCLTGANDKVGLLPCNTRSGSQKDQKAIPFTTFESSQQISRMQNNVNSVVMRPSELVLSILSSTCPAEQDEFSTVDAALSKNNRIVNNQWILKKPDLVSDWERISSRNFNEKDTTEENNTGPAMTDEEKRVWFLKTLSSSLGLIYSILLVTVGGIIYIWDVLENHAVPIAECFNIYLMVVQLLFLWYIHLDCRQYTTLISSKLKKAEIEKNILDSKYSQGPLEDEGSPPVMQEEDYEEIPQYYGFTSGRHGGSLYVKIGAAVFCFGYMIQGGLGLGQKILYIVNQQPGADPCTSEIDIAMCVLKLIYVFYKLFFIFKFSNLIINRRLYISHFGLMHCIGSSLCFWVYNILQETFQSLSIPDYDKNETLTPSPYPYEVMQGEVSTKTWSFNFACDDHNQLSDTVNELTPYLFPFSIEYNILMVGFWILMLENLGRIDRHTHLPSIEVAYEDDSTNGKSLISNFLIYVDCHASMRGLFAGLIVTVFATISIILFYVLSAVEHTADLAVELTAYVEMTIFLLMLAASLIVFYHMQELDVMTISASSADDILLFGCLPLIFLYAMACAIPYIEDEHIVTWFFNVTQIVQAIVQTALICDGLRRCSNSPEVRNRKPGREFIMFLVVANLAMWLMQTFQIKSKHGNSTAYDFYGKEIWTLVSHFTLPFVLFYRFHSSACFAMMWMEAYMVESS
ncbi:proton channel OtopLc-like [Palaemon carinicauda]|uniref:proton channel OtopLc-like n=1 Tax=Palaemon carinicauda TaxID=392227 RepID=UPI0035B5987A